MIRFIANYFKKTETYSTGRFIIEMYLAATLAKLFIITLTLIAVLIYAPIEPILFREIEESSSQFSTVNWLEGLVVFCIILPFLESIAGQAIPVWFMSFITNNRIAYLICSSLWFSFLHSIVFETLAAALIIFFAGIIYAWCYVLYKTEGIWKAIFITSVVHGLFNFTVFITFYFF